VWFRRRQWRLLPTGSGLCSTSKRRARSRVVTRSRAEQHRRPLLFLSFAAIVRVPGTGTWPAGTFAPAAAAAHRGVTPGPQLRRFRPRDRDHLRTYRHFRPLSACLARGHGWRGRSGGNCSCVSDPIGRRLNRRALGRDDVMSTPLQIECVYRAARSSPMRRSVRSSSGTRARMRSKS
jgi:hypothetical protein